MQNQNRCYLFSYLGVVAAVTLLTLCGIYITSVQLQYGSPKLSQFVSFVRDWTANNTELDNTGTGKTDQKADTDSTSDAKSTPTRVVLVNKSQSDGFPLTAFGDPYRIRNPDICKRGRKPTFVVLVHSAVDHVNRRNVIRTTWANVHLFENSSQPFKLVFFLGEPNNETEQNAIDKENSKYGDIVQGRFLDSYNNLTNKAVLWLRWVSEYCSEVPYLVKVDDDVVVNVFRFFQIAQNMHRNDRKLVCHACPHEKIGRKGKWKTSLFPDKQFYPPFCKGYFVMMSLDIVPELVQASKHLHFFRMDDVYFSGLLTHKIGNVTIKDVGSKSYLYWDSIKCYARTTICPNVPSVFETGDQMEVAWSVIVHQEKELASKYLNTSMLSKWLSKPKLRFPG